MILEQRGTDEPAATPQSTAQPTPSGKAIGLSVHRSLEPGGTN